ncbi:hypothetical protein HK099_003304, partial [Clydaea vesicula]
ITGLKKELQKPLEVHKKEPSAAAKVSVRPEMARLNIHETYGKNKSRRTANKSQPSKPLYDSCVLPIVSNISSPVNTNISSISEIRSKFEKNNNTPSLPVTKKSVSEITEKLEKSINNAKTELKPKIEFNSRSAEREKKPPVPERTKRPSSDLPVTTLKDSTASLVTFIENKSNTNSSTSLLALNTENFVFTEAFTEIFSKALDLKNLTPSRKSLLHFFNSLFETEIKFLNSLELLIEIILNPLMNDVKLKNLLLKTEKVELIFKNLLKIHQCSMRLLQNFKSEFLLFETEVLLEKGCIFFLENLVKKKKS